jgi:uncharacterized membrane protein
MKKLPIFTTLLLISLFSLALIIVRALYTNHLAYHFLLWNLFLAWLPLLFAALALRWQKRPLLALAAAFLWLLFFPNAPYLVTDLIHLRSYPPVPLWYDLILLLDFALLGLFLGFVSLGMMHSLVNNHFGHIAGWSFVLVSLTLGGLGVFIGRFLRWNSWDLFTRPLSLLIDVSTQLTEPRTIAVTILLTLLMLFAYIIFSVDFTAPAKPEVANFS